MEAGVSDQHVTAPPTVDIEADLRLMAANQRLQEDEAIAELLRRTPEDDRGILVTRATIVDDEGMRIRSTVARSDDLPNRVVGYRYEYDEPRGTE
jgi:hypothetical protein